ncbi:tripartite tricarboxylate transporter substrate-binding protein [Bradyrhizobium sp. SYSU BS000235]|uniref:tripartite tricarboxylate transporter substrate-binding protein n=1 Tax=Bradyrhizobium sp. SYSU BS000235 TaxID=3411332 RepID=UPI003C795683
MFRALRFIAALMVLAGSAQAQSFPNKVITLVVPFAAGGPSDVIARLIAQPMSQSLGQQIIIENVVGAGGTLAAARVARAAPDGYTIMIHHLALAAAPSLYSNLTYNTRTAFSPLGLVNTGPMVLLGKKTLEAKTASELIAYMKAQGSKLTMAHAGNGSNAHLCAILLGKALNIKPVYVPYNGTGPAMNDLVSGQVDVLCDQSTTSVPQILGGGVKGYIVTSDKRLDVIKDVVTAREAGLPQFDMTIWHGLYAPAGIPPDIVAKLNDALRKALADPMIVDRFIAAGTTTFPSSEWAVAAHKARFEFEVERWNTFLKEAGVAAAAR